MRFTRGVTLEPDTVRDFAREMNIAHRHVVRRRARRHIDRRRGAGDAAHAPSRAGRGGGGGRQARVLREAVRADGRGRQGRDRGVPQGRRRARRRAQSPALALDGEAEGGRVVGGVRHGHVRRRQLQPRHPRQHAARQLALRAAGDQGRRHDRHGHPPARRLQLPDRPDGAGQRALHQAHPAVRDRATPRRRCSPSATARPRRSRPR